MMAENYLISRNHILNCVFPIFIETLGFCKNNDNCCDYDVAHIWFLKTKITIMILDNLKLFGLKLWEA